MKVGQVGRSGTIGLQGSKFTTLSRKGSYKGARATKSCDILSKL